MSAFKPIEFQTEHTITKRLNWRFEVKDWVETFDESQNQRWIEMTPEQQQQAWRIFTEEHFHYHDGCEVDAWCDEEEDDANACDNASQWGDIVSDVEVFNKDAWKSINEQMETAEQRAAREAAEEAARNEQLAQATRKAIERQFAAAQAALERALAARAALKA